MNRARKDLPALHTIGDRIRYLLEVRKMKQTEVAQAIGITQAAISNIVTNASRKPSAPTLLKLAAALQCNPHWIVTGQGEPFEINTIGRTLEKQLIAAFRDMDADAQTALLAVAETMRKE